MRHELITLVVQLYRELITWTERAHKARSLSSTWELASVSAKLECLLNELTSEEYAEARRQAEANDAST